MLLLGKSWHGRCQQQIHLIGEEYTKSSRMWLHVTDTAEKIGKAQSTPLTSFKPAGHLPHTSHVPATLRIVVEEILGGATEITTAKTGGTSAVSKGFP